MDITRIEVLTEDRLGMTYDVSRVFVQNKLNIIWMEVYTHVIYIKYEKHEPWMQETITAGLLNIPGVKQVREIDFIMIEESRLEAKAILNSITQGLMILKKHGRVKYVNNFAAKNIFKKTYQELVDVPIEDLIQNDQLEKMFFKEGTIQQKSEALEVTINNQDFILDVNPITSDDYVNEGIMITLQDIDRIGDIFNRKRFDNPITLEDVFGVSMEIKDSKNKAKMFAKSDSPVLILGESGTGKEIFARAIHNESERRSKIFVALNCAALPDQLLESELFGYEAGTFTGGKKKGKVGLLEIADGGTIFFDEIGEMSPQLQAKLLRVLQESKIRRLGGTKEIPIDFRVLSATNRHIKSMISSGHFRLDLYYRINVFTLELSPLRERIEDMRLLANKFVSDYAIKYQKKINQIHPESMNLLLNYDWPGNVRELQNVMERAVAITEGNIIFPTNISLDTTDKSYKSLEILPFKKSVQEYEKDLILKALKDSRSIREAARKLEVTHTLLLNRIKKYNIQYEEQIID